jgi:hypothetical protein
MVRLGEHDLTKDDESNHRDLRVEKIIIHEQFKNPAMYNDIAIVK